MIAREDPHAELRGILFLVFFGIGLACLLGGLFLTRLTWRADVEPYGRRTRFLEVVVHPERFARGERLAIIRALTTTGALSILLALAVIAWELATSIGRAG